MTEDSEIHTLLAVGSPCRAHLLRPTHPPYSVHRQGGDLMAPPASCFGSTLDAVVSPHYVSRLSSVVFSSASLG